jgi:hypothetical protein
MDDPEAYSARDSVLKSWKSQKSVRDFFDSVSSRLLISNHTDWYRVSRSQIGNLGGVCLCLFDFFFR